MALACRSWAALVSVVYLQLHRVETGTLLPSTLREEELDYEAHAQAAVFKAKNRPVPPPAWQRTLVSTMEYNIPLKAMCRSVDLLRHPLWPTAQKRTVELFVRRGLDVISRTAGKPAGMIAYEDGLVAIIKDRMTPRKYSSAFCTAVLRKWRSNAVSSVFRARGVLHTGVAQREQNLAEFKARQSDDIATHGLRDCALPSCAKTERTVKEFSLCAGCRSQVYCCLEHQALDWKAHKKACREREAARLAEEEADDEGVGVGAATT